MTLIIYVLSKQGILQFSPAVHNKFCKEFVSELPGCAVNMLELYKGVIIYSSMWNCSCCNGAT